jgi:hypothetical protein
MQARYLATLIVLELGFYALAGAWLSCALGVAVGWCILLAALTAIGLRLVMVGTSFALAYRYRSQRPAAARLTAAGTVKLFVGEALAYTALFTVLQPLER